MQAKASKMIVERGVVEEEGLRVDRWAADHFLRLPSRAAARKAVRRGDLQLNAEPVESSRFVRMGDVITLRSSQEAPPANHLVPELVYIDDHLAVVIKPAGVLTMGPKHRTLERGLPNAMKRSVAPDAMAAPRPVHRLDYETYGLVVVARTESALAALGTLFETREVNKTYSAYLAGRLEGSGTIDTPIDSRDAISRYEVVDHFPCLKVETVTVVRFSPVTGRTHQLRRHAQGIDHPILGDRRYTTDLPVLKKNGLFLAAIGIELLHPITGETLSLAIEPPQKFATFRALQERRWHKFHP